MEQPRQGLLRRFFGGLWRTLDGARRIAANLLFLALVVLLISWLVAEETPQVPDPAALVIAPQGDLVEQLEGDPLDRAVAKAMGEEEPQTLLWDLLDAIDAARDDDRIQVLLLDLDGLGGAGLSKLQDLRAALERFQESGKRILASADLYSQEAYYLASAADEIYLHEMGLVLLPGYGRYRTYYKEGLDRLGVDVHVFRVGEYKAAVEPYLRNDMSPEAREANLAFLDDLWGAYLADVAVARGLSEDDLAGYATRFPELLRAAAGDAAQAALEAGLVDQVAGRDGVRDRLVELLGEDEETHGFPSVDYKTYLEARGRGRLQERPDGDQVGVILARGTILDGSQPPGQIGGDSTAVLIRQARHDDNVKALVLRVDSGGGSAFASEVIRRELALARAEGKPVVVSMGSVAASGGYWIATASDEIWSSPTTLTGSIGIFGVIPTFQRPLERYLGMRVDGVGTTPMAGALRLDRELPREAAEMIQLMVDRGYQEFLERVAEARGMTPDSVDRIARGRIWSGEDALELGLVDHLGGFDDAIAAAARRAALPEDGYGVRFLEREPSLRQQLLADLITRAATLTGLEERSWSPLPPSLRALRALVQEAETLVETGRPNGLVAHCLCEVESAAGRGL